ncbi:MAG: hypothetical protein KF833_14700 [Verrucomicrobiae bacterium]|nr:hypothetical protein [Verrucomicrobiae bacterium]
MNADSAALDLAELIVALLDWIPHPTAHQLRPILERWDPRHGFRPQFRALSRAGLAECRRTGRDTRISLTPKGRAAALGGLDPAARWSRPWDGQWRFLLFDLTGYQPGLRMRLWRWLRQGRLGCLQNSVWISPDRLDTHSLPLRDLHLTPDACTVIQGRPAPPDQDADLVRSAWDFTAIDTRYRQYLRAAEQGLDLASSRDVPPAQRRKWLRFQRLVWRQALSLDPVLPSPLCPPSYLGRDAFESRAQVLARWVESDLQALGGVPAP